MQCSKEGPVPLHAEHLTPSIGQLQAGGVAEGLRSYTKLKFDPLARVNRTCSGSRVSCTSRARRRPPPRLRAMTRCAEGGEENRLDDASLGRGLMQRVLTVRVVEYSICLTGKHIALPALPMLDGNFAAAIEHGSVTMGDKVCLDAAGPGP
eukprot:scaffold249529_cov35-Tisochrysis_lutea.AAC.1